MIFRERMRRHVLSALRRNPITAILGPRQSGKTTLARMISQKKRTWHFDLEDPAVLAKLENPKLILEPLRGLVIIDEIQRKPDLFPMLRVLADRRPQGAKFLILGSASPEIVRAASETLAGRIEFIELGGFLLEEVGMNSMRKLWVRGGMPRSFLSRTEKDSLAWRENFIRTFLERDIPQLGVNIPAVTLRKFWTMLAHYHGQILNSSELGRSMGLSDKTIRKYLDILCGTFVVRQISPWYENLAKRQVKSPKVYIRDSGLLHRLLGVRQYEALTSHPKCGASWEGFALEQILSRRSDRDYYFWSTHQGAELDLLFIQGKRRIGFEFKYSDSPKMSKSMRAALISLGVRHLYVVYPGREKYPIHKKATAIGLSLLLEGKDGRILH